MDFTLIIIGVIMCCSGIVIWILGHKRHLNNIFLWGVFPFIHGIHEFFDFVAEEIGGQANVPFIFERMELFFAFASAAALLGATIEYNGVLPHPTGDISAISVMLIIGYMVLFLPESVIDAISVDGSISFGVLVVEPFRFVFGFIITLFSLAILFGTYLSRNYTAKKDRYRLDPAMRWTTITMLAFLSVYAIFEGFESTSDIFVGLRGISLALFVVIPLFAILTCKLGLQRLIIINVDGTPLLVYDFVAKTSNVSEKVMNEAILTAGFLMAINSFSSSISGRQIKRSGLTVQARGYYFTLIPMEDMLFSLQALATNKELEKQCELLVRELAPKIKSMDKTKALDQASLFSTIRGNLKRFY